MIDQDYESPIARCVKFAAMLAGKLEAGKVVTGLTADCLSRTRMSKQQASELYGAVLADIQNGMGTFQACRKHGAKQTAFDTWRVRKGIRIGGRERVSR